uniref:Velvet domain-containing protein n=1 Tax=Macrostomum lignano TaxID=282301 RepID=A0A1I8FHG7_9PLAT
YASLINDAGNISADCGTAAAANTPETSGLNVWLDRSTLAGRKPHKANRCRPKRSSLFTGPSRSQTYPLVENGTALLYPTVDFVSARGIALAFNVNKNQIQLSSAAGSYEESQSTQHNSSGDANAKHYDKQGYVPAMQGAGFFIELQCTNLISGITGFEMHMTFYWPLLANRRMIVMQRHFKKACLSMRRRQARKCPLPQRVPASAQEESPSGIRGDDTQMSETMPEAVQRNRQGSCGISLNSLRLIVGQISSPLDQVLSLHFVFFIVKLMQLRTLMRRCGCFLMSLIRDRLVETSA